MMQYYSILDVFQHADGTCALSGDDIKLGDTHALDFLHVHS